MMGIGGKRLHPSYREAPGPWLSFLLVFVNVSTLYYHRESVAACKTAAGTAHNRQRGAAWIPRLVVVGVFGPARMPPDIVSRLNTEIRGFMGSEDVKTRLSALGAEVETDSSEEFSRLVRSEITRWAQIVKASGARVN